MLVDWSKVHYFTAADWGPLVKRLDPTLIYAVDDLRALIGVPIMLGDAIAPGHDAAGEHPRGRAVDCHAIGLPLLDFWLAAERIRAFGGIGIYPFWVTPGLHLDTRLGPHRARWWRDEARAYHPLTAATLAAIMVGEATA